MQPKIISKKISRCKFQSMHPIKDATVASRKLQVSDQISIHAPYKGCNQNQYGTQYHLLISIHAPYKGCND